MNPRVQGNALFPTVTSCVSEPGIWCRNRHTPFWYHHATGRRITLNECNSHSCACVQTHSSADSIIPETRPQSPCANLLRMGKMLGFCMTGNRLQIRINLMPIRICNKVIYNIKLWLIYIKIISTTQGTYWCYQMLSNSLYIQIYINLRYEQALDCSIPDTMFSAEYSYLSKIKFP